MIYTADVTVPKNTAVGSEKRQTLKITNGVIHKLDIMFPAGCAGLVKVGLFFEGTPLFPSTAGMTFSGDDETVTFPEFVKVRDAPRTIVIKASNIDTEYDHTVGVRIGVLSEDAVVPSILGKGVSNILGYIIKSGKKVG